MSFTFKAVIVLPPGVKVSVIASISCGGVSFVEEEAPIPI